MAGVAFGTEIPGSAPVICPRHRLTKKRRFASPELPPSITAITQARKSSEYLQRRIASCLSPVRTLFHSFKSKMEIALVN